jgi:8-oxo-dGTP pyrophosphatase MutT (NUDIX family)
MDMSSSNPVPVAGTGVAAPQVAALCWRLHKSVVQVLLITSRETGRWVIPKGWPMAGLTPSEAALREAWEEAGVQGRIQDRALGEYLYDKVASPVLTTRCAVAVFPLQVQALKRTFPEAKQRRRRWFSASKAAQLVAEPDLAQLLRSVAIEPGRLKAAKPTA